MTDNVRGTSVVSGRTRVLGASPFAAVPAAADGFAGVTAIEVSAGGVVTVMDTVMEVL